MAQKLWSDVYLSAIKFYNEREWDKSITLFKTAIKIDPAKRIVYGKLLSADLFKTIDYNDNDFTAYMKSEISYFTSLISKRPGLGVYYSARSNYYEQIHDYDNVLADITQAIKCNPKDSFFYSKRGYVYQRFFKGKDDLALSDYKRAISLHYYDTGMFRRMDEIYRKPKNKTGLINVLNELVDLTYRKEAMPYILLAKAYEENGNTSMAVNCYDRAYKIDQSPATLALGVAAAQKLIAEVDKGINHQSASIPNIDSILAEVAKRQSNEQANEGALSSSNNTMLMAPKVERNNTCPYCGGMGKVETFGTHLGYVNLVDDRGRLQGSNYQTITDFHYETCRHCGGIGKIY